MTRRKVRLITECVGNPRVWVPQAISLILKDLRLSTQSVSHGRHVRPR